MATDRASKTRVWIALGGLVAVPLIAMLVALASGSPDRPRRAKEFPALPVAVPPPDEAEAVEPAAIPPAPPPPEVTPPPPPAAPPPAADPSSDANEKLREARRVESDDPALARKLLREALELDPENPGALETLSLKLLLDENHEEAQSLADRCLKVSAGNRACEQVANYAIEKSPTVERLAGGVTKCLEQTPNNTDCLWGMVNYHLVHGRVNDAAMFAGRLSQAAPDSPMANFGQARIKSASGKYGEAKPLMEMSCRQGNQDACFRADLLRAEGW